MVVNALRGAVGFLTRLRVGHSEAAWRAFRTSPWAFPVTGYAVGGLLAVPFSLQRGSVPAVTVAFAYLAAVFAVTGINHLDGVADAGDAVVVHGDASDRRSVLKDTNVGVGAVAALALVLLGLTLGALGAAALPLRAAAGVVVAAEVGAKAAMAVVACVGSATHEGLGSQFTTRSSPRDLGLVGLVALPAAALSWPSPAAPVAAVAAVLAGVAALAWLSRLLGGVNGDVFGVVNEVGRLVGLHVGVVAWTLS